MVEGGVAIVKYLLFLANLLLWTGGIGIIILGAVLQLSSNGVWDILGDEWLSTPILLLVFGCFCTLVGFLGCCGAIRENYCLTVSFAVLLAMIIMIESAVVITAYALQDDMKEGLISQLQSGLKRYKTGVGVKIAWDNAQQELSCCGVTNSSDWLAAHIEIPDSCCIKLDDGCVADKQPLHIDGCMEKVQSRILLYATHVGFAATILAALQILGICFACCLSKSILKDFHDFYY